MSQRSPPTSDPRRSIETVRKVSAAALCVLLVAVAIPVSSADRSDTDAADLDRIARVELDPGSLLGSVREDGRVTLPTVDGAVTFTDLEQAPPTVETVVRDGNGTPVAAVSRPLGNGSGDEPAALEAARERAEGNATTETRVLESSLWRLRNGDGAVGTLILRPGYLEATLTTADGPTVIEPVADRPYPADADLTTYRVVQPGEQPATPGAFGPHDPGPAVADDGDPGGQASGMGEGDPGGNGWAPLGSTGLGLPASASGPEREKTVRTYVDTEWYDHYDDDWCDKFRQLRDEANEKFREVGLEYTSTWCSWRSWKFQSNDRDELWDELSGAGDGGRDVKGLASYKDWDGCAIGVGSNPGSQFMIQAKADQCHFWAVPDNDYERAYVLKHEWGHNNDAKHKYAWNEWDGCCHNHRSIMYGSAWGHWHDVWSQENADRMCHHLNTGTCTARYAHL